jgi:hypothetical protein
MIHPIVNPHYLQRLVYVCLRQRRRPRLQEPGRTGAHVNRAWSSRWPRRAAANFWPWFATGRARASLSATVAGCSSRWTSKARSRRLGALLSRRPGGRSLVNDRRRRWCSNDHVPETGRQSANPARTRPLAGNASGGGSIKRGATRQLPGKGLCPLSKDTREPFASRPAATVCTVVRLARTARRDPSVRTRPADGARSRNCRFTPLGDTDR